ncbi:MAG: SPOR domain-containing protein [Prevotella sp.]|jgi:cell division protein FtsN
MKKSLVLFAGLSLVLVLSGCKSKESAYRKAYEKAQAQEEQRAQEEPLTEAPVVTPLETAPASETTVKDNYDNVSVRNENVTLVNGAGLKAFSVVVGSFSLKANAEGLQSQLKNAGYDAQIAYNPSNNMYRVIATTFDDKGSAVQSRNQLRAGKYADAWLLYNK